MDTFGNADEAIHTLAQQIARITERMPEEKRVDFFEQLLRQYPGSNRAIIEMALGLTGQMPAHKVADE